MCLKEFHVTVHLPGPVLHQLHHLTHDLDLLVAQLLAPNQRPLNAGQHPSPLGAVRLPLELLAILIQLLQDFMTDVKALQRDHSGHWLPREPGRVRVGLIFSEGAKYAMSVY